MEEVRYHQIVSPELIQRGRQFLERLSESRFPTYLAASAGSLALLGAASLPLQMSSPEAPATASQDTAVDCIGVCDNGPQPSVLGRAVTVEAPSTIAEAPAPLLEIPVIEGVHPVVNERMRAVQITPASMADFLAKLDLSKRGVIQQTLAEFNPLLNKKPRAVMDEVTLHTMAGYYDDEGKSETPRGPFNVEILAKGMAASYGDVLKGDGSCCGTHAAISRDAYTYLLAGMNDPLQHNPPYDAQEFAIEIEAFAPPDVKTPQWEEAAKMSLLKLRLAGNKDPYLLVSMIKGHGQRRQELYNEYITTNKWKGDPRLPTLEAFKKKYPYKGDVLGPESELFRQVLLRELMEHPALMTMPLPNLS